MVSRARESLKTLYGNQSAAVEILPCDIVVLLFYAAVNCMRISELLELRWRDYIGNGRFIVKGRKRSRSYAVHMPMLAELGSVHGQNVDDQLVIEVSYKRVWQWCERAGIGFRLKGQSNCRRTHAHRYVTASTVSVKTDDRSAGDCLHHNSGRSVSYYIFNGRL